MPDMSQIIPFWEPFTAFMQDKHLHLLIPETFVTLIIVWGFLQLSCIPSDPERQQRWGFGLSMLACGLALGFLGWLTMQYDLMSVTDLNVWRGIFRGDLFSLVIRIMLVLGTMLTMLFSRQFVKERSAIPGEFYLLMLSAMLGGMFLAGATDLIMLFVGLETLSISSYILVGYLRGNLQSTEASLKYLVYGGMATALLLFGFSLMFAMTYPAHGSTAYQDIAFSLINFDPAFSLVVAIMTVMILAGFCFKLSAAPFHMWAPDVYEGAPTPVTAFLAVVSKIAAFAVTIRFCATLLHGVVTGWEPLIATIAVLSMVLGNVVALTQTNIKRLLAYSTVAHVGYLLLGLIIMTPDGLSSLLYYLMTYLFMNLGAFAVVVRVQNLTGREDIGAYAGLIRSNPGLTAILSVMLLSLAGIPITAGFFGKFFLFWAVANAGTEHLWLVVVALLTSTISLYYYLNVIRLMVISEPSDAVQQLQANKQPEITSGFATVLGVCTAATLLLGMFAGPFMNLAERSIRSIPDNPMGATHKAPAISQAR